jgi:hypothetical protein
MNTTTAKNDPVERLMRQITDEVKSTWGRGFDLLSADIQSALLSERLLIICDSQDESVDPATVRRIMSQGRTWIINWVAKNP